MKSVERERIFSLTSKSWFESMRGSFKAIVEAQRLTGEKSERDQNRDLPPISENTQVTFWGRVKIAAEEACWPWIGSLDRNGYGTFSYLGKRWKAHRLAYQFAFGDLRDDRVVRHACDNTSCCNPLHLSQGTSSNNVEDRDNRQRQAKGSKNGRAKLTEGIVARIRAFHAKHPEAISELAKRFGINPAVARDILRGKTWKHVPAGGAL